MESSAEGSNNVQQHGTKEAALAAGKAMNNAIVASAAKRLVKYSLYTHLKFRNPRLGPPQVAMIGTVSGSHVWMTCAQSGQIS